MYPLSAREVVENLAAKIYDVYVQTLHYDALMESEKGQYRAIAQFVFKHSSNDAVESMLSDTLEN